MSIHFWVSNFFWYIVNSVVGLIVRFVYTDANRHVRTHRQSMGKILFEPISKKTASQGGFLIGVDFTIKLWYYGNEQQN